MPSTIDSGGRVVIPAELRREAGLEPGTPVEITLRDGAIEIVVSPAEITIVKKGKLRIAVPRKAQEPLTSDEVDATIDASRSPR